MRQSANAMHAHLVEIISILAHAGSTLQSVRREEADQVLLAVEKLLDLQRLVTASLTPEEAAVGVMLAMITDDTAATDPVTLQELAELLQRQGFLRVSNPSDPPTLTGAGKALLARLQAL